MINISDWYKYNFKKARIVDIDGKIWNGVMSVHTDYDTDTDTIELYQKEKNIITSFNADEIKSIEIIE
jgi:hypothetical protein